RDLRPLAPRREVPRLEPRRDRGPARARLRRGDLRRSVVRRGPRGGRPCRPPDGIRHDRRPPARRRLEVPLGGHVHPRSGRDGGGPRGRGQLVVTPAAHPGPSSVRLPVAIVDELIAHARAGYPNEACGLILGSAPAAEGGRPLRFAPTRNAAVSPHRYEIDSADLLRLTLEADE